MPWYRIALFAILTSIATSIVYIGVAKFNLDDPATSDVHEYIAIYNGGSIEGIEKPFRYRVVVPELARLVPDPPDVLLRGSDVTGEKIVKLKFGLVNIVFLLLAAWSLFLLLGTLSFGEADAFLGALLFLGSFWVLLLSGIPLVDAGAYGVLAFGCLACARDWRLPLAAAVLVGMFVKETSALLLVFALCFHPAWRTRIAQALACLPGLAAYVVVRLWVWPTSEGYSYSVGKVWGAIPDLFAARPLFEIAATFGPLWILAAIGVRAAFARRGDSGAPASPAVPARLLWFVAAVVALMLANGGAERWVGAVQRGGAAGASSFGRTLFLAFPVVIPYALVGLRLIRARAGAQVQAPAN
jgi:hypothetical protein